MGCWLAKSVFVSLHYHCVILLWVWCILFTWTVHKTSSCFINSKMYCKKLRNLKSESPWFSSAQNSTRNPETSPTPILIDITSTSILELSSPSGTCHYCTGSTQLASIAPRLLHTSIPFPGIINWWHFITSFPRYPGTQAPLLESLFLNSNPVHHLHSTARWNSRAWERKSALVPRRTNTLIVFFTV